MKMTSLQDSSNHSNIFKNINSLSSPEKRGMKRNFRNVQPSPSPEQQHTNKKAHKENYQHVFYHEKDNDTVRPKHHASMKKLVPQTFTTSHDGVEPTKSSRPTMGGKTIGSIHKAEPMSFQELKLLSRRIDPHEPLPSPHASPRKPPLPNIKGLASRPSPFSCESCNKQYKTRNGLTYHLARCKHRRQEVKVAIQCICLNNVTEGTMIECTQCHAWLHMKCVQQEMVQEDVYLCPRCSPTLDDHKLETKEKEEEDSLAFVNFFSDEAFNAFMDEQTTAVSGLWDSDFNSADWYNTADIPSLLLSDNGIIDGCSTSELLSSSNMPSSPLSQSDWLSFTNLDDELDEADS